MRSLVGVYLCLAAVVSAATPNYNSRTFDSLLSKRQSTGNHSSSSLVVDLGYDQYMGVANLSTGLNTWKGIRYAAAPTGPLRWQPPQAPAVDRSRLLRGDTLPQKCPQSPPAHIASGFNLTGNEDCLFLSVYSPRNATNLPVFVYIHGGGYGAGQGNTDMSPIINANNDNFVAVAIQYRLGAFGFLSSDEVMRYGAVNAGLLDQTLALQWVQSYIGLFGGNASQVTIGGDSAGGGSGIAASPYLPMQYGYADFVPSQFYYAFAAAVGCFGPPALPQSNMSASIFQCLIGKDTETLQNASATISGSSRYGTWAFLPVTDGVFVQQLPSQQLLKKQLNGQRLLVGNNANEGPTYTPQNIVTEDDFVNFIRNTFPLFTKDDISRVLLYYPSNNASVDTSTPKFATSGTHTPTALNESTFGTGQQQRADNLYAETTFVCPSYWLAEAFTGNNRVAFKYQYSVIGAWHTSDVTSYFGPPTPNQAADFNKAFMTIWGNFITQNDPSIPASIANGVNGTGTNGLAATNFPPWNLRNPQQLNLNESGGQPYSSMSYDAQAPNITQFEEPGLMNDFSVVDAYSWEGGRGVRCDFWRSVGSIVPE
ncbi:carboxylesterase type B [Usnea florida]